MCNDRSLVCAAAYELRGWVGDGLNEENDDQEPQVFDSF